MTRAEKWLIVAAAGELGAKNDSWYKMVEQALSHLEAQDLTEPVVSPRRYAQHDWDTLPILSAPEKDATLLALEPHFGTRIKSSNPRIETVSPSDLGGAKIVFGDEGMPEALALNYGTLVHELLEHLTGAEPADINQIVTAIAGNQSSELVEMAKAEVTNVLSAPHLSHIFANGGLSEVTISAQVGDRRIHGAIDRLVVSDSEVLAIDYKSNRIVPDTPDNCPEGLKRQMGAYAHALASVYPGREIKTAILWTRTADLMVLSHDIVTFALMRSPYLDVEGQRS